MVRAFFSLIRLAATLATQPSSKRSRTLAEGLLIVSNSARRILAIANDEEPPCDDNCWPLIVDLMHASQWVRPRGTWSTYDELRSVALPTDRLVIEAVERMRDIAIRGADGIATPPEYRAQVRRMLPIALQDAYWSACWSQTGLGEAYTYPCERPSTVPSIDAKIVASVVDDSNLMMSLREWASIALATRNGLFVDLQTASDDALASIAKAIEDIE